jgi:hypothetical protein
MRESDWSSDVCSSDLPGSTIQWLNGGHVGAFLCHRSKFRTAIRDAFAHL